MDSGLPDFRGNQGFWRAYPPLARRGFSFVEMANPSWFDREPAVAWGFYGHRLNLYRATTPHEGFQILKRWGTSERAAICSCSRQTWTVSSSVPASIPNGSLSATVPSTISQCAVPCRDEIWSADEALVSVDEATLKAADPWPECPYCGRIARPNVLMFGDWAWVAHRSSAQHQRLRSWLSDMKDRQLVVIELGAGTAVPTVRSMSEQSAAGRSRRLIRINTREASAPPGQISLGAPALQALQQIDALL